MMKQLMILPLMLMMMGATISSVTGQEIFDANNLANVPMDMTAPLEYPDPEEEEILQSEKLPMKSREGEITQNGKRNDEDSDDAGLDDDFDDIDADDSLTQASTSTVEDEDDVDDTDDDLYDDNSDTLGDFMTASGIDDGESRNSLTLVPSVSSTSSPTKFSPSPASSSSSSSLSALSSYISNSSPSNSETQGPGVSSSSISRSSSSSSSHVPKGKSKSIADSLFSSRMSQVTPAPASPSSVASLLLSNMLNSRVSQMNANFDVARRPNLQESSSMIRQSFNNMINEARGKGFSLMPLESSRLTSAPVTARPNTIVVSPTIAVPFASGPGIVLLAQMDNSSSTTTSSTTTTPPPMEEEEDYEDDSSSSNKRKGDDGKGKGGQGGGYTICPFNPPPQYVAVEKIIPVPRLQIYEEDDENKDHHDYARSKKGIKKEKGSNGYTQSYDSNKDEGRLLILAEEGGEEEEDEKKKKKKKKKKDKKKDKGKKCKKGKCSSSSSHILVAVDESAGRPGQYR